MFDFIANPENFRGTKIEIFPTESQKEFMQRHISIFRWVYNWTISIQKERYLEYKKFLEENPDIEDTAEERRKFHTFYGIIDLMKKFSEMRSTERYEWLKGIETHSAKEAMRNALSAFENFFNKKSRFPRFKSKKTSKKSFQFRNDPNAFYFKDNYVRIPGMPIGDKVLCKKHNIPVVDGIRYYRCTITFDGYRYWLSVNTEVDKSYLSVHEPTIYENESIGIDVGARKMAQLSTGETFYLPDTKKLERRKRQQQRRLSKMRSKRVAKSIQAKTKLEDIPFTKNEEKLQYSYYKTRQRIKNIKNYNCHQVSNAIVNMYPKRIVMEDLQIKNLMKTKYGAKVFFGNKLFDLRKQIQYKCKDRGIEFVLASKTFPSTKTCSRCGEKHKVGSEEIFVCPYCGFTIDRDLNAAINLSRYGMQ